VGGAGARAHTQIEKGRAIVSLADRVEMSLILPLVVFITVTGAYSEYVVPPARLRSAPYPEWAHYHWVWLSNDRASQASMTQYAQEYLDHGIKVGFGLVPQVGSWLPFQVGAVDIDSGWSTGFNNFIFDAEKYPNATAMVTGYVPDL
jgi:hypothetical protein